MGLVRYFRDLEAWKASMELAVAAHKLAALLPSTHRFELAAQIRKSAVSIPSNVAEGHAQHGDMVFLRHVRIALGSLAELDTQVELAIRLELLQVSATEDFGEGLKRTGQLLHGLRRSLMKRAACKTLTVLFLLLSPATLLIS